MKKETIERIFQFSRDRDWSQFHTPANLAKSISIEANELLECFQWDEDNYCKTLKRVSLHNAICTYYRIDLQLKRI